MSSADKGHSTRFLSIVLLSGESSNLEIESAHASLSKVARESADHFELLVVRTPRQASSIESSATLSGVLNNSIFIELPSRVGRGSAAVIALQQAIGDWVLVLDLNSDQVARSQELISAMNSEQEVVFGRAASSSRKSQRLTYRMGQRIFGLAFKAIHGANISLEAPVFRLMSRAVVNSVLAARRPEVEFRSFITTGAFKSKSVVYQAGNKAPKEPFWESYASAMQMLLGGTKVPMRFASLMSLFGAIVNVLYSIYVVAVAVLGEDIQSGWASTSLQISAMFFLVCVVLFFISEYLLQILPDREHAHTVFSTSFDGDKVSVGKDPNVKNLRPRNE